MSPVGPRRSVKVQNPGFGSSRQCHLSFTVMDGGNADGVLKGGVGKRERGKI